MNRWKLIIDFCPNNIARCVPAQPILYVNLFLLIADCYWRVPAPLAHNLQHFHLTMEVLHVAGGPWSILWSMPVMNDHF